MMRWLIILYGFAVALLLGSCTHKDIVCPGSEPHPLEIAFMWDEAPDATVDGMTVYFFPADTHSKLWRFDIPGRDGGSVELPAGRYSMIAVNNDLRGVTFSQPGTYDDFSAFARTVANSSSTVLPTGMLYGAAMDDVQVTMCGVSYRMPDGNIKDCPYGLVRCYPDSMSVIYHVILRDIEGLDRLVSASARLSGIAASIRVRSGECGADTCATSFALERAEGTSMTGVTSGLGTPSADARFMLEIAIRRTDRATFVKTMDVTGQVLNSPYPRNVYIYIDSLQIPDNPRPDNPGTDVGIDVGVDGWHEVEINYDTDLP